MKDKICIVVTARASWARVQTVVENLRQSAQIVFAGSAAVPRFSEPAAHAPYINCKTGHGYMNLPAIETQGTHGATSYTATLIQQLNTLWLNERPRKVVVIADRYETLAVSIAAAYNGIPLVHLLGGERSGNIDDKVRDANTALADVHCVATNDAFHRLNARPANRVYTTGCPSVDLALRAPTIHKDDDYGRAWDLAFNRTGVGARLDPDRPIIVGMYHPCADDTFSMLELLNETRDAAQELGAQVAWFWPNIDPGAEVLEKEIRAWLLDPPIRWRFFRHLPAEHFLSLLKSANLLVGNSSVGVREAGVVGIPVLNLGHRQRNRLETHNVRDEAAPKADHIYRIAEYSRFEPDFTYGDGAAGAKIAAILEDSAP